MKMKPVILALTAASLGIAQGQTSYTSTSSTGLWFSNRWNNTTDAAPYTAAFTANNAASFAAGTYTFTGGGTGSVGNVTLADGASVTFSAQSGTWGTGGNVRTLTIGSGSILDLNGNSISTTVGTGFIKDGAGVLGTGAGTFAGGFTLNAGTVIARGTTGLGSGAANTLVLNGGVIASNATRTFDNTRFGGGITIGGNVQFGELATVVSLASSSANLSFANNVSLGGANRTLTQGNNGTNTFSAVISNTGSGGITFAANANTDGRFEVTNTANTFTGDVNINGGEVRFTTDGSMGNAANDITIDGGRFSKASDSTTVTLGAGRTISIGDGAGTSISSPGSGALIYNGIIADKSGETGSWAKQGGGILELGGASSYTGSTAINNGIVKLTTGNNRLPAGTVVSIGQAASTNLGTLDLNGLNQQIAGLNSTTGTNAGVNNNTVTSVSAATLTIDTAGSNTYSYGDGTAANSGVIAGAISLVKSGSGTQILGDANTYTGATTISQGTLVVDGSTAATSAVSVASGATLGGKGTIIGSLELNGALAPGSAGVADIKTLNAGTTTWNSGSIWNFDLSSTSNASDQLAITGDLVKGTGTLGTDYVFNFMGSQPVWNTTYTLATFTSAIGFLDGLNFTATNLGPGSYSTSFFTLNSGSLTFTAVPEPSSTLAGLLIAAGLLRRRRAA